MAEWYQLTNFLILKKVQCKVQSALPGKYTFITAAEEWKTHQAYTHDC